MELKEILKIIDGRVIGNEKTVITKTASALSTESHIITFAISKKYAEALNDNKDNAVIITEELHKSIKDKKKLINYLIVDNPAKEFYKLHAFFYKPPILKNTYLDPEAFIAKNAKIGKNVFLGRNAYISEDAEIGSNTVISENVYIGRGVKIGNDCILYSGAVVGSEGFRYVKFKDSPEAVAHVGNVIIEDKVRIGANCTIDRATFDSTVLKQGVKLDNLVHIGHNCFIGENTLICACACLSGSVTVGKNVWIGPNAVISNDLIIGDNARVNIGAVVIDNLNDGDSYSGFFARPHLEILKFIAHLKKNIKHKQ